MADKVTYNDVDPDIADQIADEFSRRIHVEVHYKMHEGTSDIVIHAWGDKIREDIEKRMKELLEEAG